MANVVERLATFDEEFAAVESLLQAQSAEREEQQAILRAADQIRSGGRVGVPLRHFARRIPMSPPRSEHSRTIRTIAFETRKKTGEQLERFDAYLASQALQAGSGGREILQSNFERLDRIEAGLSSDSSHVAVIGQGDSVTLFESHGPNDLKFIKTPAQEVDNGHHSHITSGKEGIYLRLTNGSYARIRDVEDDARFSITKDMSQTWPVYEQEHDIPDLISRHVEAKFDPADTKYMVPFVELGAQAHPKSPEEMKKIFESDEARFSLRAIAHFTGQSEWLTVERPSEGLRQGVASTIANYAYRLLADGPQFDAASRGASHAIRATQSNRGASRNSLYAEVEGLVDRKLPQIGAFLHGAGISLEDVKEVTLEQLGKQPTTMREVRERMSTQQAVVDFFDNLAAHI